MTGSRIAHPSLSLSLSLAPFLALLAGCAPVQHVQHVQPERPAGPAARREAEPDPLSLEAAREAHRRAEHRRLLQFLEATSPGFLLRSTAGLMAGDRIDRGEVSPRELYEVGRLIFDHEYTAGEGLGNGGSRESSSRSAFRRVQKGRYGGPDTNSCGSCHWRGGPAGAGGLPDASFLRGDGDRTSMADARNPPALQGAGVAQALAEEMSAELQGIRARLVDEARRAGRQVEGELAAKGIRFGVLRAAADGTVDASGVEGVDSDLVIKPFGWKGTFTGLREMVEDSLQIHFGIQSEDLLTEHRSRPDAELLGAGPDPEDPDGDGVRRELSSGQLTALVSYLAMLELPVVRPPQTLHGAKPAAEKLLPPTPASLHEEWARGRLLFREIGCAGCHTPVLVLKDPVFRTRSAVSGKTLEIDLSRDASPPRLRYDPDLKGYPVWLFSDLKRHDLGDKNAARTAERGVEPAAYLTRRLWGLADSGPYMYDGSAPSLDHAIESHAGEAAAASTAYGALNASDMAALRVYLLSLRRERRWAVP